MSCKPRMYVENLDNNENLLSLYLCVAFDSICAATISLIVSLSLIFDV